MPSTNTTEIVEAVVFGIVAIGMWIFSAFFTPSKRWSQTKNNQQRVLKTTAWLYGWASFFLMASALILVLGAGAHVRGDGVKVEWVRWVFFIIAGALVSVTVMFYYEFERWPDLILWTLLVATSWAFGTGLVLTGGTKFCALFSVLGGFILLAFGFWLFFQSRIMWVRVGDFLPSAVYIVFSVLIWVTLWLGPAAGKVLRRHVEVTLYIIFWFLLIMGESVVVWIFYSKRRLDFSVSSAVRSAEDARQDEERALAAPRAQDPTIVPRAATTPPGRSPPLPPGRPTNGAQVYQQVSVTSAAPQFIPAHYRYPNAPRVPAGAAAAASYNKYPYLYH